MSEAARAAVIEAHCRELKLPTIRREYPALVRQATHDGWDYEEFLVQLIEAEVLARRDSAVARLLRQARFPDLKTLEQLDWDALQGVERPQLSQLAACEYIERAEDVVIAGPIGTGKTHLAIALGVVGMTTPFGPTWSRFDPLNWERQANWCLGRRWKSSAAKEQAIPCRSASRARVTARWPVKRR